MRVTVLGAGAMGSFVGAALSRQAEVTLVGRRAHVLAVGKRGLRVEGLTEGTFPLGAATSLEGAPGADLVVLTTKAYDTPAAARSLREAGVACPVLSLQNGLTNVPELLRALPASHVLGGTTTHGVTFLRPGAVRHAGRGATQVGTARGPPSLGRKVASLFTAAGLPCASTSNLRALLWRKAVVNAAINPVTACLGEPNGEVLRSSESRLLSRVAAVEAARVAAAEGVAVRGAWETVRAVLEATASNRSSMLQDIEAGRRTEVDSITGEVVRAGRRHALAVPANEGLLRAVRALQSTRPAASPRLFIGTEG